jgi:molybdopterin-guanine dinucleotide biosynthesis protein A
MKGIVLCGGKSMRMGTDKALLNTTGITWVQAAANKLAQLPLPVALSVNEGQYNFYSTAFTDTAIIKDNSSLQLHGPLSGLLSVHLQYPLEDIFVLACDMQLMETLMLAQLYSLHQTAGGADAYIFTNDNEPEPLCGIYCAKGLSDILKMNQQNNLPRHSMKCMLAQLTVHYVPISQEQKKYFTNFNSPSDLNEG